MRRFAVFFSAWLIVAIDSVAQLETGDKALPKVQRELTLESDRTIYKPGQKVQGELTLGSDGTLVSTKRTFPLPQGEWMVITIGDRNSNSHDLRVTPAVQFGSVYLVQQESGRVTAMLYAAATVAGKTARQTATPCARSDLLYQNKYSSTLWDQRCLELFHHVNFLVNPTAGIQMEVKASLVKFGLTVAPVMISSFYSQYDQTGNYIRFQYLIDPARFGIKTDDSALTDSAWHKDRLSNDPARLELVRQFSEYSEKLSAILERTFQRAPLQINPFDQELFVPAFTVATPATVDR